MDPPIWPSLTPQIALAERLFAGRGAALLDVWLDRQVARISDPDFARFFSDHIDLPGIAPSDYTHRLVRAGASRLLGGIRFYGHDPARPFVEVIVHDFADWKALRDCVTAEWRAFEPLHLRTLIAHGATLPPDAYVDVSIHLARYGEMAPPDGRVRLTAFETASEAIAMTEARYRDLAQADPALARNISPASPDEFHAWHATGQIKAIRARIGRIEATVGLLAIAPGAVEWIEGDEVNEEVVARAYRGHGFAASAQRAWAAHADINPDRLLVGTIDRLNVASRRTAFKAGRDAVLNYALLPLGARP